ncbi:MAG: di-trans,poly-cis-decaprenylcistransferase [Candidatus Ryanbacteria bacterium RIFCSPHIGHO2_02_FULL_48_12]|uniref:Isoprenyl transferase n=1 Tax=Candidatus Ryanbacteria bacterium RIFCSPHIGHO2_01_FULL_48_27 TaxID=1802115 RepID=A0A1G2FZX0_9BACT|nr:MAG: di-trans,poly-cis-decaprenylcistransferase [Candidatus Ryanbacteria bacterium RIFCSPHIGHO2_01_FULL_48_27]OGZ50247.1 MAG: di-trans,poly-cis-decaprenylcistransferase [Candidatus Ryanbacteria bacterium RIFCSPHIGHO2_02_FULL_48_12]
MEDAQQNGVPRCIGVIVDGNRRWARAHGLPTLKGHEEGYKKLKDFVLWAKEAGSTHVIAYVFSSENWNRAAEEVSYLMGLIIKLLKQDVEELGKKGIRLRIAGVRGMLPQNVRQAVIEAEEATKDNTEFTLCLALSYGGRDEIVEAVNKIIADKDKSLPITKETFAQYLWTSGIPDPDMIIRTSGEMRLSNFLPWQGVYSELFFLPIHWPDITKEYFMQVLEEYKGRQRRYGK